METNMRRPNWKSLASSSSSRLSTFKDYLSARDIKGSLTRRELQPGEVGYVPGAGKKQSWSQWASSTGQKIAMKVAGDEAAAHAATERVVMFPGWASRRFYTGEFGESSDSAYVCT